jgi:catalase
MAKSPISSPSRNTRAKASPPATSGGPVDPTPPPTSETLGSLASTVSGPAVGPDEGDTSGLSTLAQHKLAVQKAGTQKLAAAMPFNAMKEGEHGLQAGQAPQPGTHGDEPDDIEVSGSTVSEDAASDKVGDGVPTPGHNPLTGRLDRVRVDSQQRAITTNQGVAVADNQNSLKGGLRGPTLMEDFILREKITHFDHERIPERVVHARGSGAHGVFECYESLADVTKADLFSEAGKRTPVFVRFSTVAGERGSADTVRDTRGFATKFYTEQGNWDLVGNNIPVFFIQDAMKFPDIIHAVKPEPHHAMPQASSAHDTFWDFISLMPESMHHTLWVMSDRGIPRSYRTMQGFGVNTYRLVDAAGVARFVKFHWLPLAGTHSLVWDESAKITGADPDFHRRDLWESIESGNHPEYELALQVFTEEQAESFSFDILDPTKLVPEELVPLRPVGRMVLNRNPDNFFAETEQVAFCTAHVVPGIDFSNDPLLQGRIHSYVDTQLSRLGGPNFHELPINAPLAQVHNNQRDGMHRQALHRGRVSYEPNSLAGGCPHQAGMMGFVSASEPFRERRAAQEVPEDKVRAKPEKFADHYSQAQLFWRSQTPPEKRHIIAAFRFELSRVTVPAVRERVVSQLLNVDAELAQGVADGLGMALPPAQPLVLGTPVHSEVEASPGLSLFARPGLLGPAGRRVALLVVPDADVGALRDAYRLLAEAQAVPRFIGLRLGRVAVAEDQPVELEGSIEALPSVLWDGVVLPSGPAMESALAASAEIKDFVKEQYRHCKPLLLLGPDPAATLSALGIAAPLDGEAGDPGLVLGGSVRTGAAAKASSEEPADASVDQAVAEYLQALARHRHFERELEVPRV